MMKRAGRILTAGVLLVLTVVWLCEVREAGAAAPYKRIYTETDTEQKERMVGSTVFEQEDDSLYAVQNGMKQLVMKKKNMHPDILTNGEVVYVSAGDPKKKSVTVYRVSSVGKGGEKLFSCSAYAGDRFELVSYYGGKLCYTRSLEESEYYELCEYTAETGKTKAVMKEDVGSVRGHGAYVYITPNTGGYDALQPLRVYDIKKGKLKTVCRYNAMFDICHGSLYYLETIKEKKSSITVSVKKCNLDGGKKKTLIKKLVMDVRMVQFKKNSITYYDAKGKKRNMKYEK